MGIHDHSKTKTETHQWGCYGAHLRIMSGIWCGGHNADGSYDVEISEGLSYRV